MIRKVVFNLKKIALLLAIGTSAFLVACGDKDEATNLPDNAPTEQNTTNNNTSNTSNTTTTTKDAAFNFTHFDLDVKYANNQSYEVSYENEATGAEAEIEEKITLLCPRTITGACFIRMKIVSMKVRVYS